MEVRSSLAADLYETQYSKPACGLLRNATSGLRLRRRLSADKVLLTNCLVSQGPQEIQYVCKLI